MKLDIMYFAWLRERIGDGHETVDTAATTVSELVAELSTRSPAHALALSDLSAVRVAVDQELTDLDAPITQAREVAFFPPMTGG